MVEEELGHETNAWFMFFSRRPVGP
jgi:hypothetical protein